MELLLSSLKKYNLSPNNDTRITNNDNNITNNDTKVTNNNSNIDKCARELFDKYGIKLRYNQDLLILRYYRWSPNFCETEPLLNCCRGTILERSSLEPICYTFQKRLTYDNFKELVTYSNISIYQYYDGTMINLYYYNNNWCYSTKGILDADQSKWRTDLSFRQLFENTCQLDYQMMDTNYCYSFVLQHQTNRIISNIKKNRVILVLVRNRKTGELIDLANLSNSLGKNIEPAKRISILTIGRGYDYLEDYVNQMNYNQAGVIIYGNTDGSDKTGRSFHQKHQLRTRLMSTDYLKAAKLRGNYQSLEKNLLLLDYSQTKDYLTYFPEDKEYTQYLRHTINDIVNQLLYYYQQINIYKQYIEIPPHLRKTVHLLHDLYKSRLALKLKYPSITHKIVKAYVHNLNVDILLHLINTHYYYYLNSNQTITSIATNPLPQ